MAAIPQYEAPRGGGRIIEFRVKGSSGYLNLSTLQACDVVVDNADGTTLYTAPCAPHVSDPTIRLVRIEGTATATAAIRDACVHWTDTAGVVDAERFRLVVYDHA
jgi:hypothetical protein